jgi:hypothetical protein
VGLATLKRILDIADETWIARRRLARKHRLEELLDPDSEASHSSFAGKYPRT